MGRYAKVDSKTLSLWEVPHQSKLQWPITSLILYLYMIHIYIDEAGRWPLAWPVYVGLVVGKKWYSVTALQSCRDSKKLSEKQREVLFKQLQQSSICWSYAKSSNRYIDRYGIVAAIRRAIIQWIKKLDINYKNLIENKQIILHIDGNTDFGLSKKFPWLTIHTYIKGDDKVPAISAASIIAKVLRDREMVRLDKKYPDYWFAQHKGYGTQKHRKSIATYWLSRVHRRSFCKSIQQ